VALVVTLLVLVLVVALCTEIFRHGVRASQTAAWQRDSVKASLLGEGGVRAAALVLREDRKDNEFDTLDETWSRAAPPIELGNGAILVTVEDEERKFDVNRLVMPKGVGDDDRRMAVFRRLLRNLALDESIADAVADWLDADDSPRSGGAESASYQGGGFPYKAKNDLFDTVEELRLVRGVTPEVFARLRPFVTVHSADGKVNLNTAPRELLMALSAGEDAAAGGTIDEAAANRILERRVQVPFRAMSSLKEDMDSISPALGQLFRTTRVVDLVDVRSSTFHVRSTGSVNDVLRTVDAFGTRSANEVQWRVWRLE
jgi:general secretion pathway protein K